MSIGSVLGVVFLAMSARIACGRRMLDGSGRRRASSALFMGNGGESLLGSVQHEHTAGTGERIAPEAAVAVGMDGAGVQPLTTAAEASVAADHNNMRAEEGAAEGAA